MITKLLSEKGPHCFYMKLALYIRKKNNLRLNTVDTAHFLNREYLNYYSPAIQDLSPLTQHSGPLKVMNNPNNKFKLVSILPNCRNYFDRGSLQHVLNYTIKQLITLFTHY